MTELILKYDHGQMTIDLEAFLECRRIGKVKKLLKLVDNYHIDGVREQIRKHVDERIPLLESSAKMTANEYVNVATAVKEKKAHMAYIYKNSTMWKKTQTEITHLTKEMNSCKRAATNDVKNLQFYKKVRELFS